MFWKKKSWLKLFKNNLFVAGLIVLFILPGLWSLLTIEFFHTHDVDNHLARMVAFAQEIKNGQWPPRWASNLYGSLGYPIFIFQPILAYVLTAPLILSGLSLIISWKIVLILASVFSAVFMFLWLKEFLSRLSALMGALFYFYAPYRFVDLYVRGAIGEIVAFAFIPLLFYFLQRGVKSPSLPNLLGGGLAYALLITAHPGLALIFSPVVVLYILFLASNNHHKVFIGFGILLVGLLFSTFYWLPAIWEDHFTKRKLIFDTFYQGHFVYWYQLFQNTWGWGGSEPGVTKDGMSFGVGWLQWMVALLTPFVFWQSNKHNRRIIACFVLVFIMAVFLMLQLSEPIWQLLPLIKNLQFPWRLLSVSVFTAAVLSALLLEALPFKKIFFLFLLGGLLITSRSDWKAIRADPPDENLYYAYSASTATFGENDPVWVKQAPRPSKRAQFTIIQGDGIILTQKQQHLKHSLIILGQTNLLLENETLYFPGWEISVDGQIIPREQIQEWVSDQGKIRFAVTPGKHQILLTFQKTPIREVADLISLSTLILASLSLTAYYLRRRF